MKRHYRFLSAIIVLISAMALASPAFAKHEHHDGKKLVEGKHKGKEDGEKQIDKKGPHTVFVTMSNGKIAGMRVNHESKGDIPVKKYKTNKKMAQAYGMMHASYQVAQAYDLGTTYIGYAYVDAYGNEVIYWFPYEMILDGATGAIDYVPLA